MASQIVRIHSKAVPANYPSITRLSLSRTTTRVATGHFSTTTLGAHAESGSTKSSYRPKQQQDQSPVNTSQRKDELKSADQKKTVAELDKELMEKMSGIAGDGGSAGVEYEDGQPVAMKRSVKNNMFRYI